MKYSIYLKCSQLSCGYLLDWKH